MSKSDPKSLVESVLDSIVSGEVSASEAVDSVLGIRSEDDTISFAEGEEVVCPECGSHNLEEGFLESEDGSESYAALQCGDCGCQLIAESDEDDDAELVEAEIDEDDPACPACGSDDLSVDMVESEDGEEDCILGCGNCGATMLVVD